jgi:hypothetical protein
MLPMPPNSRDIKLCNGNYKYRQCLQGDFYPGKGNYYRIVPPMLATGANIGLTSFLVTLHDLIKKGKVGGGMRKLIRQTDGGPDIMSWVTYAIFAVLVREGSFDEIIWLRLHASYSHNEADAWHRRAMAVFYPNGKKGPGCASPFEYREMLLHGLSGMSGGCEILAARQLHIRGMAQGLRVPRVWALRGTTRVAISVRRDPDDARLRPRNLQGEAHRRSHGYDGRVEAARACASGQPNGLCHQPQGRAVHEQVP